MHDPFGRRVTYLRVSVTDRCDLRCTYCMAEEMTFLPRADLLTLEELDRVCRAFISLGVEKLRITGGEPLVRKNVMTLFQSLGQARAPGGGLRELTLTTNGTQLARHAESLAASGVRRLNISLDSLDPERFHQLTRRGDFAKVMDGIMAAKRAGLAVKLNTVALRGLNDHEFDDLVGFCGDNGFDLCFIETMPLGEVGANRFDHFLPLSEVRTRLERHWTLTDSDHVTGGPARYVTVAETGRRIGFISPLSHGFCESCNRVRLTCTGTLYLCLGQEDAVDLRTPLRASPHDDGPLIDAIQTAIAHKPKGHDFIIDRTTSAPAVTRHMSLTGG